MPDAENADFGTEDQQSSDYREATVEADDGTDVQIEEYPGGDMAIYQTGGEKMYFTPEQAKAFRTALGRIDGGKNAPSVKEADDEQ